jgi:hypothetical protein
MIGRTGELQLLLNLKARLQDLTALLQESSSHWGYEDPIYRFYHHSFKVFALQSQIERIVSALRQLLPSHSFNTRLLQSRFPWSFY